MTTLLLRVLERIHGHLGWLTVAALLHPAVLLRNPKRRAPLAVSLSGLLAVATPLLGVCIYPAYRSHLREAIFVEVPALGWMFERKEHLAVATVAFAVIGCLAHLSLWLVDEDGTRQTIAQFAHRAFVIAFALALVVAVIGVCVASYKSF